jgi:hypothetical protein
MGKQKIMLNFVRSILSSSIGEQKNNAELQKFEAYSVKKKGTGAVQR